MKHPLTHDNLYLTIIQNAASNSKLSHIPKDLSSDYIEGIIRTTTQIVLDVLKNQRMIENFTVTWAKNNGIISDLVVQIQKDFTSRFTVYKYPRGSFSVEIMQIAEVMIS
jgi:hypothetical protein